MRYARYILAYFPVENNTDDQVIDEYVEMIRAKGGRVMINSRDFAPQLSIKSFFNIILNREEKDKNKTGLGSRHLRPRPIDWVPPHDESTY